MAQPGLSSERIAETRRAIHHHLQQADVYGSIRSILSAYAAEHAEFDPNSPDAVMRVLKERGIVQQVLGNIGDGSAQRSVPLSGGTAAVAATSSNGAVGPTSGSRRALHVRLMGGRAFLDNFDGAVVEARRKAKEEMVVHLQYGAQRFRSAPLPAACDPAFDDDFLVTLEPTVRDLIETTTPLQVLVTMEDGTCAKCRTLGENTVEWRRVLKKGVVSLSVELAGLNPGVPAGVLDLQLELLPGTTAGHRYSDDDVQYHIEQTRAAQTAADREFLIFARRWWSEYHAIRPSHAARRVKVFAQSTSGRMLPVTHYVDAIEPDRVFDGPEDAARFVSLLGVDCPREDAAAEMLSGLRVGPGEQWLSPFNFLAQRRGDAPNHAALLCSLFLGFGLDAYCVVGAPKPVGDVAPKQGECVVFVATLSRVRGQPSAGGVAGAQNPGVSVQLWDPCRGSSTGLLEEHGLATIDCAFNSSTIFANVQESTKTHVVNMDLEDESMWMAMSPMKLRIVPKHPPASLLYVPRRARQLELELEEQLRAAIAQHRDGNSLPTLWDDGLSAVFGQALAKYELSRRQPDAPINLALFHQGVKGKIGDGRTFKGCPIHVTHTHAAKILAAVLNTTSGRAILESQHDDTYLSLRVKLWVYPENVLSVWIMAGARYRNPML